MTDKAVQTLEHVFPKLSAEALADFRGCARLAEYPAQVTLCRQGEAERGLYIIVDGSVDVYKVLEGQRQLINQMTSGAHFGYIPLLHDMPHSVSAVTAQPTQVWEIDQDAFTRLLKTHPEIAIALSQLEIKRFLTLEQKHLTEIARLKKRDLPPAKVFISYARADNAFVSRLADNLLKQQIDVWLDVFQLEPGKSWARQVGKALDTCQIMLVVLSPTCVASENVEDEWNYYLDQKKPVVAVLHRPCKIPYRLSKLHYINFYEADYDQALARVVATLNTQP